MIIISDTSVISSLIQVGHLEILKSLFDKIIIPPAVDEEIRKLKPFRVDISFYESADWIEIRETSNKQLEQQLLASLDKGESSAITLAYELNADYLAIDEKAGRKVAKSLGIEIIGLLGIIIQSKNHGIILKGKPILDRLISDAGFYIGKNLYDQVIKDLGEDNT